MHRVEFRLSSSGFSYIRNKAYKIAKRGRKPVKVLHILRFTDHETSIKTAFRFEMKLNIMNQRFKHRYNDEDEFFLLEPIIFEVLVNAKS